MLMSVLDSASIYPHSVKAMTDFVVNEIGCDFCLVAETSETNDSGLPTSAATVSISTPDGSFPSKEIVYALAGTPCETVANSHTLCFYPEDVAKLFPADKMLEELGVVCYMGIPLFSSKKEAIGIMCVLGRKSFSPAKAKACETLLRLCGARISSDVERERLKRDCEQRGKIMQTLSNEIHKLNKESWYYKMIIQKFDGDGRIVSLRDCTEEAIDREIPKTLHSGGSLN